jgi:hypothetical protein
LLIVLLVLLLRVGVALALFVLRSLKSVLIFSFLIPLLFVLVLLLRVLLLVSPLITIAFLHKLVLTLPFCVLLPFLVLRLPILPGRLLCVVQMLFCMLVVVLIFMALRMLWFKKPYLSLLKLMPMLSVFVWMLFVLDVRLPVLAFLKKPSLLMNWLRRLNGTCTASLLTSIVCSVPKF